MMSVNLSLLVKTKVIVTDSPPGTSIWLPTTPAVPVDARHVPWIEWLGFHVRVTVPLLRTPTVNGTLPLMVRLYRNNCPLPMFLTVMYIVPVPCDKLSPELVPSTDRIGLLPPVAELIVLEK